MTIWNKIKWIFFGSPIVTLGGRIVAMTPDKTGLYVAMENGQVWLLPDKDGPVKIKDGIAYTE